MRARPLTQILLPTVPLLLLAAVSCGDDDDNDARQDLAVDSQHNDTSDVTIGVFPDKFPNTAHKCQDYAGVVVGSWTTTDRILILVYNDWACEGANREQPMQFVTGSPKAETTISG